MNEVLIYDYLLIKFGGNVKKRCRGRKVYLAGLTEEASRKAREFQIS